MADGHHFAGPCRVVVNGLGKRNTVREIGEHGVVWVRRDCNFGVHLKLFGSHLDGYSIRGGRRDRHDWLSQGWATVGTLADRESGLTIVDRLGNGVVRRLTENLIWVEYQIQNARCWFAPRLTLHMGRVCLLLDLDVRHRGRADRNLCVAYGSLHGNR